MRLETVLQTLRRIAPENLAESWDKVGLAVGDTAWSVRAGLLCIDLTEAVLAEAKSRRANLIVAYHPPIFKPLDALTSSNVKQRVILNAAAAKIAIYSPHTALDAASGGVNDWLCDGLGTGTRRPIVSSVGAAEDACKLVTFVPVEHADTLRASLAAAGAGRIGAYDQCSFGVVGEGSFRGGAGTNPTVGRAGRLERVPELRLEMICPKRSLADVLTALRATHPYEEPAFDIYPLIAEPVCSPVGMGRVLELDRPASLASIVRRVKRHLGVNHVEVSDGSKKTSIRTIGVCAGAGGSLLDKAGPIDLFLTGEMRHHDVLDARTRGINIILAGHTQTERPYLHTYANHIRSMLGNKPPWYVSNADIAPSSIE